jgi:hypothetical protein
LHTLRLYGGGAIIRGLKGGSINHFLQFLFYIFWVYPWPEFGLFVAVFVVKNMALAFDNVFDTLEKYRISEAILSSAFLSFPESELAIGFFCCNIAFFLFLLFQPSCKHTLFVACTSLSGCVPKRQPTLWLKVILTTKWGSKRGGSIASFAGHSSDALTRGAPRGGGSGAAAVP